MDYEENPMLQNLVKKPKKPNKLIIIMGAIILFCLVIILILALRKPEVINTETLSAGSKATIKDNNDGLTHNLTFGIPGSTPVNVGTVTTLAAGSKATVVNGGSAYNMILNFGVPMGNTGAKGEKGDGWECKGFVDAVGSLPSSGQTVGDLYLVGTTEPYDVYVYKGTSHGWVNIGNALEIKASVIDGGRADTKYGGTRTIDCGGADAYLTY